MPKPECPACKSAATGMVEYEAEWQPGQDWERWECSACHHSFQIMRSRNGYVDYVSERQVTKLR